MAVAIQPNLHPHSSKVETKHRPSYTHHDRLLRLLSECPNLSLLKQIHAQALRTTSTQNSNFIFLYSRILHSAYSFDFDYAYRVFTHIENPNSFMWNTMIGACARSSARKWEAIMSFCEMMESGLVLPDKHTFPFLLKATAYLVALSEGKQAHTQIIKLGLSSDIYICNSLIHFYASCGCLDFALKVFDKMSERSLVSWNVMIDGFVQIGDFEKGLSLFSEMQNSFEPDLYTMNSVIIACGGKKALALGIWAHSYLLRKLGALMATQILLSSSLVEMYCKCGCLKLGKQVFEAMPDRDLNSWNAMISGFAMHGEAEAAFECFNRLVKIKNLAPNSITFVGVLSACNHRGMVTEGRKYFDMMIKDYKIEPRLENYSCLVDLLARSGQINDALDLVRNMKIKPDVVIWRSILDALCRQNGNIELSEEVARTILRSENIDNSSGVYVLLSRIYASANKWNDVGVIRKLMTENGVKKEPGCSLIEINGESHEFFAGDTSHPQIKQIYETIELIEEKLSRIGYLPDYSEAHMVNEINEVKRESLRLHSERLAISFGLLRSKQGMPIRIFKNLRVCIDCHRVIKLISKIFGVEIIMRDRNRFHHFKDGVCSCMDFW